MASKAMDITGDKELLRVLRKLPDRARKRVARGAVSASATPVVKAAKKYAPRESDTLSKAQGKKIKSYPRGETVVAIVGARTGISGEYDGEKRVASQYDHLVHDGHINADGSFTPGSPYLALAFDLTKGDQLSIMKRKMRSGIVREAKKLGRKK